MEPTAVTIEDETILVPRLKVQQIIDLGVLRHERERKALLEDLEDAEATTEERLEKLREHRDQKGLSSILVRSAFSVDGAYQIVRLAMGGEYPERLEGLDPTKLSRLALACIGIDLDDMVASGEAVGKEMADRETGHASRRSSSATVQG